MCRCHWAFIIVLFFKLCCGFWLALIPVMLRGDRALGAEGFVHLTSLLSLSMGSGVCLMPVWPALPSFGLVQGVIYVSTFMHLSSKMYLVSVEHILTKYFLTLLRTLKWYDAHSDAFFIFLFFLLSQYTHHSWPFKTMLVLLKYCLHWNLICKYSESIVRAILTDCVALLLCWQKLEIVLTFAVPSALQHACSVCRRACLIVPFPFICPQNGCPSARCS